MVKLAKVLASSTSPWTQADLDAGRVPPAEATRLHQETREAAERLADTMARVSSPPPVVAAPADTGAAAPV